MGESESNRPLRSTFVSTTGGVMTDEVGAITGELELLTRLTPDGGIEAMVRYTGAQDLYTVLESPVHAISEQSRPGGAPRCPRAHPGDADDAGEGRERQRAAGGPVRRLNLDHKALSFRRTPLP